MNFPAKLLPRRLLIFVGFIDDQLHGMSAHASSLITPSCWHELFVSNIKKNSACIVKIRKNDGSFGAGVQSDPSHKKKRNNNVWNVSCFLVLEYFFEKKKEFLMVKNNPRTFV